MGLVTVAPFIISAFLVINNVLTPWKQNGKFITILLWMNE